MDGVQFGMYSRTYCYLPVFYNTKDDHTGTWYLGSLFMKSHVFVFDNTPFDENGKTYNQVGIGLADPLYAPKDVSHEITSHDEVQPAPKTKKKPILPPAPASKPLPTPAHGPVVQWIIDHLVPVWL